MTSRDALEVFDRNTVYTEPMSDERKKLVKARKTIEKDLKRKEKLESAIKDLLSNHIDFVCEKDANGNDRCYFKIKNSKGKEKSFTSKTFEDFWKEVFENDK